MPVIKYREVVDADIPALAKIRGENDGTEEYWSKRITGYLNEELHPQKALHERVLYVAEVDKTIIGFVAGHLTQRFNCDGELEWIDVVTEYRNKGIGRELICVLAKWFVQHTAFTICVDPGNELARKFYLKYGAENLNQHWLFWKDISVIKCK